MAVYFAANDANRLFVNCNCQCGDGFTLTINELAGDTSDTDEFAYLSYISSNWYAQQEHPLIEKLRKIWRILRNKDYYYSEIWMTRKEFETYRNWLNNFDLSEIIKR